MGLFERRRPIRPQPFAGAELLREVVEEGDWSASVPSASPGASEEANLNAQDNLLIHAVGFVIVSLNLVLANCAHRSHGWWFWMPVAAWSAILVAHAIWVWSAPRFGGKHQQR